MTVEFDGRVARSGWALQVDQLAIAEGVTAVVGANGTGKTTLGRAVAGLDRLERGRLEIAGTAVDDPGAGVFVPAHRRRVGMVFQDHRLFGHLRVIDNVAFGLRRAGADRAGARRQAVALLERVGVDPKAWQRRPAALSGGQRQRVAVARALAPEPEVLIVDEPLASVDSSGRASLRALLGESPARHVLLITHDPVDVATLARRLVVLDTGAVVSRGSVAEVTASPGCEWAATFLGANVVPGRAQGTSVTTEGGLALTVAEEAAGSVYVTFPAHAVTLHRDRPAGSARNAWQAELQRVDIDGERARVHLGGPVQVRADVTRRSADELDLRPGLTIWASLKATELTVVT
ncbi:MAG: ABC transporter ATP-binding protein [Acidimicrobiaceae bacterium]|nr:ABC transporter ATP-binding protein [Acidimicrobiaceae bacterium]MYF41712.1 ABC transporter ATP-binding protein [Acidimicrobiaceae bacterium]MYJ35080.1 ABC transporter ATP-binding protein [Acidimicrobiaceae bacterium]